MGGIVSKGKVGQRYHHKHDVESPQPSVILDDSDADSDAETFEVHPEMELRRPYNANRQSQSHALKKNTAASDSFNEHLRDGYVARCVERDQWLKKVNAQRQQDEIKVSKNMELTRPLTFTGSQHRRVGWPAGGMHEHGW